MRSDCTTDTTFLEFLSYKNRVVFVIQKLKFSFCHTKIAHFFGFLPTFKIKNGQNSNAEKPFKIKGSEFLSYKKAHFPTFFLYLIAKKFLIKIKEMAKIFGFLTKKCMTKIEWIF